MKSKKVPGSFRRRDGRWGWRVRLPGETKAREIALVPEGGMVATKDYAAAEDLAQRLYQRATLKVSGAKVGFDGTVAGLVQRYMEHARGYYVDPHTGQPSREANNVEYSAKLLVAEYPLLRVDEFGPARFKALREKMVRTVTVTRNDGKCETKVLDRDEDFNPETMRRKYARGVINQRMGHIKRIFGWAVEEELVSGTIHHALLAVRILTFGRTMAREGRRIGPVEEAVVQRTMKYATPLVSAMIELQMLTGMRPGEVCIMRPKDLDVTNPECWLYRPYRSKNERFGIERVVPIVPAAQRIIQRYWPKRLEAYIFSPKVAKAERYKQMRENARCPSPINRCKLKPERTPGDYYDEHAFYRAIQYAIRRGRASGEVIPHWHPNQIRHTVATIVENTEGMGADMARALLGHRSIRTTQIYVQQDTRRAAEAARRLVPAG